jgi:hypothetical protein
MANGVILLLGACMLAGCAPQVIYVEAPPAAVAEAATPAAGKQWSGAELRTASSLCGNQDNWVSGVVAMRDSGYELNAATEWIGYELETAFELSRVDARSEAGTLAIVIAAGVVESVYTEPFGSVDEELASWEDACFNWLAEVMASAK